ncbi:MAG: MMPL family transporter [Pseudomonadota bacterium]
MTKANIFWRWAFVLFIVAIGSLACLQLKVKDDAVDLLPGEAVRGDIRQLQRMGLVDRLFITLSLPGEGEISAAAKTALQQSAAKLGDKMTASGHFSYVLARLPKGYEFALFARLQASLPMLLNPLDLQTLAAKTSPEGIRAGLAKSFALLNSPTGIALKKQVQLDPLGFVPLVLEKLNHLRSEHSMRIDEGFFMSRDGRSCLLVAESRDSLTNSQTALTIQKLLDDAYPEVLATGVEARVIGSLPHTLANSQSIKRDLQLLLPVATILLLLLLSFSMRDIRALVVFSVPYLAAPPAIGITRLVYGDLSGMALGFGIVLLGIAIDFPIHLYFALTRRRQGSWQETLKDLRMPLLFAALTTMAGFIMLLFSQVVSHRQMGLLALVGVGMALVFSWLLIPTIAQQKSKTEQPEATKRILPRFTLQRPAIILGGWLAFLLLGIAVWPQLRYNGDLRALDVPDRQVMADEKHFTATWGEKGEQAFIVAEGATLAEVLDCNGRVASFLQKEKITQFQSFAPLLPGPGTQAENREGWDRFWSTMRPDFDKRFIAEAVALGFTTQAFTPFLSWLDREPETLSPEKFLGGPLQPLFASMLKVPSLDENAGDNKYLAMTTVAIDAPILKTLLKFAESEPQVMVLATMKWRAEVERLLRHDIVTLSLAAGLAIILLVSLQYRQFRAVVAALAPVLSALAAMSLFCYLTGAQLTMMHLIMGIMVIGLAVDYGIFIVCEKLTQQGSTSALAVSLCAVSTIIGFGVLAFAEHPALHALGVTVLVGIGVAWPVALVVCPAVLVVGKNGGQ